jgi:hypothetical protein
MPTVRAAASRMDLEWDAQARAARVAGAEGRFRQNMLDLFTWEHSSWDHLQVEGRIHESSTRCAPCSHGAARATPLRYLRNHVRAEYSAHHRTKQLSRHPHQGGVVLAWITRFRHRGVQFSSHVEGVQSTLDHLRVQRHSSDGPVGAQQRVSRKAPLLGRFPKESVSHTWLVVQHVNINRFLNS